MPRAAVDRPLPRDENIIRLAPYLVAEHGSGQQYAKGDLRSIWRGKGALVGERYFGSLPGVNFYQIFKRGPRFPKVAWIPCFSIRRPAQGVVSPEGTRRRPRTSARYLSSRRWIGR